ncbi:heat shock factor 2-binding protein [Notothenia coriiceps]|uniref:Heat shock factor 2-binding protein n=1 Tax=Notothenia coriiceps TaxID=8208 RepID=A0A6I9NPT5_9TELE|nr:PREDICTED: heat shock factor 2-binding protein [Notothenia coriiceps]
MRGLKCISENSGLLPLICALLDDGDWEVCLHSVRLLQSVLLEEEVLLLLGPPLLDPRLQAAVSRLTSSLQPAAGPQTGRPADPGGPADPPTESGR